MHWRPVPWSGRRADGPELVLSLAWPGGLLGSRGGGRARRRRGRSMLGGLAAHAAGPGCRWTHTLRLLVADLARTSWTSSRPWRTRSEGEGDERLSARGGLAAVAVAGGPAVPRPLRRAGPWTSTSVQRVLDLEGAVDVDVLRASWEALLARHASLRAGFPSRRALGTPVQVVVRQVTLPWREVRPLAARRPDAGRGRGRSAGGGGTDPPLRPGPPPAAALAAGQAGRATATAW